MAHTYVSLTPLHPVQQAEGRQWGRVAREREREGAELG